jgi:hypothetical protein
VDGLFPRTLSAALRRVAGPYPVVYLTGPRQSGKTTLARATFPDFAYVNLDDLQRRAAVQEDPHGLLRSLAADAAERAAAEGRPGYVTRRSVLVYGDDEWYERRSHDVRPWWACT